jgi:GntR family transcriptional repressor for pyruvate dehydrogenase complex
VSVVDQVTETLCDAILDGRFPPGGRLPPERDLANELGASRVSVRSAVRRLIEWGIVVTRQGSGATVLPRHQWSAYAVAPILRHALKHGHLDVLSALVQDAATLRRSVVTSMIERAAPHLGSSQLDGARAHVQAAWDARDDVDRFLDHDDQVLTSVLDAAGLQASMFYINSLVAPYRKVTKILVDGAPVADTYLERQLATLDALEEGRGKRAKRIQEQYLDELDQALLGSLPAEVRRVMGLD